MAPIIPWLATLIETELENVIAWKSIVKPDPDAHEDQRPRFSDDGSNLRSVVGSPPLDSDSTIQLLEKPGSNARAKIPISDGEVSVLAILSDTAWDAYDKGLEEGEEARKGDLLLCKKLTVVSTTYGPSEERIKLRIEDLELTGNFRKVIGNPTPLLDRPSIKASRKKIEDLRLKQLQGEIPAEDDQEEEDEHEDEGEGGASDDAQTGSNVIGVSANNSDALHDPVPVTVAPSEKLPGEPTGVSRISPPELTSPAMRNTASTHLDSQLPLDITPTQARSQPRNPVRRTRGGFSIGREGFEPTRGDNLTGPQAPTLHARQALPSESPPTKPKLLDVISKLPGQIPKKRSPEPSVPVSAQVENEDVIAETPIKAKRISKASTAYESTPVSRKRYRIPRDQKSLLEHPSSWIPSAPGHQFPHPNVPIGLLRAWNAKATGATDPPPPPESSPIPMIEPSSEVKSRDVVQAEPQATAVAEPQDESDVESEESDTSEDEPIDWSQSPSRSQVLPPDSSAAHISPRVSRPGSRNTASSGSERMPISLLDDEGSVSSTGNKSTAVCISRQREQPQWKQSVAAASQKPGNGRLDVTLNSDKSPSSTHQVREKLPGASNPGQHIAGAQLKQNSERLSNIPSSLLRSPALSVPTQSPAAPLGPSASHTKGATARPAEQPFRGQPLGASGQAMSQSFSASLKRSQPMADDHHHPVRPSTQQTPPLRPVGQPARRELLGPPQPLSASLKRSQPVADNLHGPTRPSTQQTPDYRRRTFDPKGHAIPSTKPETPVGAPTGPRASRAPQFSAYDHRDPLATPSEVPTGPRASRGSQYAMSDRRSNGSRSERERAPSGDFYRPSPSEPTGDRIISGSNATERRRSGDTQTPNSTNEMESAVPRPLPRSQYHQDRSHYYRDAQQRQWLGLNLPGDTSVAVSVPLLHQSYREKYPTDPVTEQDFGKHIQHPKFNEAEHQTPTTATNGARASPQGRPATPQASTTNQNGEHEAMNERDGGPESNPTDVFTEFLNGWKDLRPNGTMSNDTVGGRPQRKLDVLSWGFGE